MKRKNQPVSISQYLDALKARLEKRLQKKQVEEVVAEAQGHLQDLRAELGSEGAALGKFGDPRSHADRVIESYGRQSQWREAAWPLAPLVLSIILPAFTQKWTGVSLLGRWISPALMLHQLLLFAFAIACFRARKLIPVPLAAFSLVLAANLVTAVGPKAAIPRPNDMGISRSAEMWSLYQSPTTYTLVSPADIPRLAANTRSELEDAKRGEADLVKASAAFARSRIDPNAIEPYGDGHGLYLIPQSYPYQIGLPRNSHPLHLEKDLAITEWTPQRVAEARHTIEKVIEGDEMILAGIRPALAQTEGQRLAMVAWISAQGALSTFLFLFVVDLAAFVLARSLKALRRARIRTQVAK
jgi:hypothetical protein